MILISPSVIPLFFYSTPTWTGIFARWQTDPAHTTGSTRPWSWIRSAAMNVNVEPWSSGQGEFHDIRPWSAPESMGEPHTYKALSVVTPPCYDTNHTNVVRAVPLTNGLTVVPPVIIQFNDVPETESAARAATFHLRLRHSHVRVK